MDVSYGRWEGTWEGDRMGRGVKRDMRGRVVHQEEAGRVRTMR